MKTGQTNSGYFKIITCPSCASSNHKKLFSKTDEHHDFLYGHDEKPLTFTIVRCLNCGLKYMNPTLTEKGLEKIYVDKYYEYLDLNKMPMGIRKAYEHQLYARMRHIAKCTKIQAGNLLDYGCGKANFVSCNSILFPQWSFYGYDFNKKIKTGKGLAKIYQAPNIKKTKLPKQSFDVVTLVETIEHFTKLTEEIKNIQAYLKKDGFLYIETGNQESIAAKLMGKRHRYYEIYHTVYFSIKTIKSFLEKNGFKIIKISDYPTNRDLKSMRQLGYAVFLRNLLMYSAGLVRLNNFSITGGMSILAQKQ